MKKSYILGALALTMSLASCDDFLNDNRYPLTSIVDSPTYWESSDNVQLQVDRFYTNFIGYGNGGSLGWFYFKDLSDDQIGRNFANWTYTAVPNSDGTYTDGFSFIRGCNQVIVNVRASKGLSEKERKNYEGIARLNRAYEYYQMVRMYGDITWESGIVDINDDDILYGPRTDRDIVMDSVLNDLNYAIAAITAEDGKQKWSKDLARAMKSEICLYEGTYCKYRTQADNGKAADAARANKYLQECATASQALMGKYQFTDGIDSYHALYNSTYNDGGALGALSQNPEVIFMKAYNSVQLLQSTISYTASSTPTSGLSKDAFDAFLFLDGKPLASTSLDKNDAGVPMVDGEVYTGPIPYTGESKNLACYIGDVLSVRDARLSVMTDDYICYTGMTWSRAGTTGIASSSGYTVAKFDNIALPVNARQNSAQNYTCAPLYWISYIYCNYAEAKAELGQFSQADFDSSIGKLYKRAKLPITTVAQLESMNDSANNMGVSSLLWEVRRCRRCELMLDNWIRYWDLIRWHQLELLDITKHPNVTLGANVSRSPVGIDNVNGYINGSKGQNRSYDKKYYFYPIPQNQINLTSGAVKQNPGW